MVTTELALFPLHTVLFPGGVVPLQVFEDRYQRLVGEDRDFGVVLIRSGREVGQALPDLHPVGCSALVERRDALPDGRYSLLCRGGRRFRVHSVSTSAAPYLVGQVEWLEEPVSVASSSPSFPTLLTEYLARLGVDLEVPWSDEFAARAAWLVGSLLQVEPPRLQPLLESGNAALAEELLSDELARLRSVGRLASFRPEVSSPN